MDVARHRFLTGGGKLAGSISLFDWSTTSLEPSTWPLPAEPSLPLSLDRPCRLSRFGARMALRFRNHAARYTTLASAVLRIVGIVVTAFVNYESAALNFRQL